MNDVPPTGKGREAAPPGRGWRALSLYSDFWTRFQAWGVRHSPFFVEAALLAGYTAGFFLFAGRQRRAVQRNLRVLLPKTGRWGRFWRSLAVFWDFAWVATDSARARSGDVVLEWELEGREHFERLVAERRGAIILTAHMGSYDVAAPLFARRLLRPLTTVRVPERRAELQKFMEEERQGLESENFRIKYNLPGAFLAVELAQALERGEIVALQGDRAPGEVSEARVEAGGARWQVPRGPFVLALTSGAPIQPLFIIRRGWRSYRVLCLPPLEAGQPAARGDRARRLDELMRQWVEVLQPVLRRHWSRWLTFEEVLEPAQERLRQSPRGG